MNLRKKFSGQLILINLFILFIGFTVLYNFMNQINQIREYKIEISNLNKEINNVQLEIKEAKENKTTEDVETIARENLNMIKSGEIIYIDINKEGE